MCRGVGMQGETSCITMVVAEVLGPSVSFWGNNYFRADIERTLYNSQFSYFPCSSRVLGDTFRCAIVRGESFMHCLGALFSSWRQVS